MDARWTSDSHYFCTLNLVDPERWLQTPDADNVEYFDDDSLATNGWFPLGMLAGIASK